MTRAKVVLLSACIALAGPIAGAQPLGDVHAPRFSRYAIPDCAHCTAPAADAAHDTGCPQRAGRTGTVEARQDARAHEGGHAALILAGQATLGAFVPAALGERGPRRRAEG